jgi:hypothetical protein
VATARVFTERNSHRTRLNDAMSKSKQKLKTESAVTLLRSGNAPSGLRLNGQLKVGPYHEPLSLPANLNTEVLDLSECTGLVSLPLGLSAYELRLDGTKILELPNDLQVQTTLHLSNCRELTKLPTGLTTGSLVLRGCSSLLALPEALDVWFLDLTGCWAFQHWPQKASIRTGQLNLRGCTALTYLPNYLGPLATLNVRDCSNLRELPAGLKISGWIDIAQSGLSHLKSIPKSLEGVDIRWQGVRIDKRLWLQPETITLSEILAEQNAERRRVLIDRFGQSRFMTEAKAEVLDEDHDSGGKRQLLRVPLGDDEPLVTLACKCPSTGRQYHLRVPPNMTTCHQAAAWMAGFDNPDDYRPILET